MEINLSTSEIETILINGSTNQKAFIQTIKRNQFDLEYILNWIENTFKEINFNIDDIRGALNGGALFITDDTNINELEHNNSIYTKLDNNYFLVFEPMLY